jgi:leader peptidase (prepilin peptidase)/N-methyltransferase
MNIFFVLIFGLLLALLVNYLADVLPTKRRLATPACQNCQHDLRISDYLLMKACSQCGKKRSPRTWIVFFVLMSASILLWLYPPSNMGFWLSGVVLAYFLMIIVIDVEHRLILHVTTLTGAALGLLVGWVTVGPLSAIVGGVSNLLIMFIFYMLGVAFAKYRARRLGTSDDEEALGFGDVTIAGVLGLMLGWPLSWLSLVYGILFAGIFSILLVGFLLATKRFESMNIFIAYGPYLVIGTFVLLFFPEFALKLIR